MHTKKKVVLPVCVTEVSTLSGLPTLVARRSLPASVNLVGRRVASGQEAQQAASDGASLLLVEVRL